MRQPHSHMDRRPTGDTAPAPLSPRSHRRSPARGPSGPGIYHLASSPNRRIEIQPNPTPGDDGEDDLYAPEHPAAQVLLLTATPVAEPALQARLGSIEGLIH